MLKPKVLTIAQVENGFRPMRPGVIGGGGQRGARAAPAGFRQYQALIYQAGVVHAAKKYFISPPTSAFTS